MNFIFQWNFTHDKMWHINKKGNLRMLTIPRTLFILYCAYTTVNNRHVSSKLKFQVLHMHCQRSWRKIKLISYMEANRQSQHEQIFLCKRTKTNKTITLQSRLWIEKSNLTQKRKKYQRQQRKKMILKQWRDRWHSENLKLKQTK